jgi:UDP-N-acetylmuramate: L-alanyl-gamma-D-glutamyl-meso-diaminopimelate ligase
MHIHILGVCGTFMGGIALLARQLGYQVSGSDANVYPPMSTQLEEQGIVLLEGYKAAHLDPAPDLVVIGNALSRGNEAVEYILNNGLRYTSGPAFLADHVLHGRWVLGVSGTHGKTSTSSLLAWILEYAGLKPGFLVGGIPENFGVSARLGESPFFIVEADEYDSAFFDKRSKFVHYHPRTLIINNLEYDHADIFPDLASIQRQFHHLVRTVPGNGLIIVPENDEAVSDVIEQGCWTKLESFGDTQGSWQTKILADDYSRFEIYFDDSHQGTVEWSLIGRHNMHNAVAAIAAARHAGVPVEHAINALGAYKNVKRRLEVRGVVNDITVYDDFAHHPTAIATTIDGLRKQVGNQRIIAVLEPRSNTMRLGIHKDSLAASLTGADYVIINQPAEITWDLSAIAKDIGPKADVFDDIPAIIKHIINLVHSGDHILIMSNGAFGGIHNRLLTALEQAFPDPGVST